MTEQEFLEKAILDFMSEAKLAWLKHDFGCTDEDLVKKADDNYQIAQWLKSYKEVRAIVDKWNSDYHDPSAKSVYFDEILRIFNS